MTSLGETTAGDMGKGALLIEKMAERVGTDVDVSFSHRELSNLLGLPRPEAGMREDDEAIKESLGRIAEGMRRTAALRRETDLLS